VVKAAVRTRQLLTYHSAEDIYVAIMGVTGSGKSQLIRLCSKSESVKIGHNLRSCTQDVKEHTFMYRGKRIHLIDTPGFDDTTRTDREVLDEVARWFGTAYQNNIQLTGILYLQRITDVRMAGTALNNLRMFKKLCGESFYPRVTLATTFWDTVPEADGKRREAELMSTDEFWGRMIERGSSVYRHSGTEESAMALLHSIIKHRMDASRTSAPTYVRMQREIAEENKSLDETSAGREVNAKILKERQKFEQQLREAKEDFQTAMQENDRRAAESIQKHKEMLEQKIKKGYEDQEKLSVRLEDMQTKHMEELAKMAQVIEEQKSMIESIKKEKEEKEERLRQMDSRSLGAVALRREIDEESDILHQAEEGLEEQTAVLEEKKKSTVSSPQPLRHANVSTGLPRRAYEWARRHPDVTKQAGMAALQLVFSAIRVAAR
jgi:myosin heavy subunit